MVIRDLTTAALRLIGVVASGETPAGQESVDALFALNRILESMSTDIAFLFDSSSASHTVTTTSTEVTLGAAGNVVMPVEGMIEAITLNGNVITLVGPLDLVANRPNVALLRRSRPLAKLVFYAPLSVGDELVVHYRLPLAQYTTLDDDVVLPNGYANMLIYSLAMDVAPSYGVSVDLSANLRVYTTTVKRGNSNAAPLGVDTRVDVMGSTLGGFDIYAGS